MRSFPVGRPADGLPVSFRPGALLAVVLLLALLCPAAVRAAEAEREMIVYVYHRPPFLTALPNEQGGALVEMTLMVLEQVGLKARLVPSTFTEILAIFREGTPFACAPGFYRTPDRERFSRFSAPIYRQLPPALIVRREHAARATTQRSVDALLTSGLRVVLSEGYWYGPWLASALRRTGYTPARTRDDAEMVLRSIIDRTHDLTFMGYEEAMHLLHTRDDLHAHLVTRPVPDAPEGEPRCLMLGRGVPPALAARIDSAIDTVSEMPRYVELVQSLRSQ